MIPLAFPNDTGSDDRLHVFVSPHFDDAVLSCGGTIHRLVTGGHSVIVMTMMAGLVLGDVPHTPILEDLHQRWKAGDNPLLTRQIEDINALESLQANYMHVPLVDCVYRVVDDVALYPSEDSLFGDVHVNDYAPHFLSEIGMIFSESPKVAYIPLGVGHHVDHQIVRDWGLNLLSHQLDQVDIKFYAEYPYLNTDNAIDQALDDFSISLISNNVILDEDNIRAKVKTITHYESQISTFWKSLEAMATDVRQSSTHPHSGDYVERFWDYSHQGVTE